MTDLIRDILDNQLRDRHQKPIGRVDGLVLELRDGEPPRVAYLELGALTLARRVHLEGAWRRLLALLGQPVREPFRIPWSKVRDVGIDIEVDLTQSAVATLHGERWLRRYVIGRIPGAR